MFGNAVVQAGANAAAARGNTDMVSGIKLATGITPTPAPSTPVTNTSADIEWKIQPGVEGSASLGIIYLGGDIKWTSPTCATVTGSFGIQTPNGGLGGGPTLTVGGPLKPEVKDELDKRLTLTSFGQDVNSEGVTFSIPDAKVSPLQASYTIVAVERRVCLEPIYLRWPAFLDPGGFMQMEIDLFNNWRRGN